MNRRLRTAAVLVSVAAVLGAACDSDSDSASEEEPTEAASQDSPVAEGVEVSGVDYAYEGVPESVVPGTTVTLQNASDSEVHEIVALRVNDDETRSAEELLGAGEEELMAAAEVRGVTVAFPGETGQFPAPSIALEQPGRYLFACFIPVGADPGEYREAAQAQTEPGPVEVDGGPPHVTEGMFAEVTVG